MLPNQAPDFENFLSYVRKNLISHKCPRAKRKSQPGHGEGCYSESACECVQGDKPCLKFRKWVRVRDDFDGHIIFKPLTPPKHRAPWLRPGERIGGLTPDERIERWAAHYEAEPGGHPFEGEQIDPINHVGEYGYTPLHDAVLARDVKRISKLVAESADTSAKDNNRDTPYRLAVREGFDDIAKFMRKIDADE